MTYIQLTFNPLAEKNSFRLIVYTFTFVQDKSNFITKFNTYMKHWGHWMQPQVTHKSVCGQKKMCRIESSWTICREKNYLEKYFTMWRGWPAGCGGHLIYSRGLNSHCPPVASLLPLAALARHLSIDQLRLTSLLIRTFRYLNYRGAMSPQCDIETCSVAVCLERLHCVAHWASSCDWLMSCFLFFFFTCLTVGMEAFCLEHLLFLTIVFCFFLDYMG